TQSGLCLRAERVGIPIAIRPRQRSLQYGGGLRERCVLAASVHHARSSAKRGNTCCSVVPNAPIGCASASSASPIGPTASVLEMTTIPISDSVPCHITLALAPEILLAE